MLLRNKKTGEVVELFERGPIDLYFYPNNKDLIDRKTYQSLAELNADWEDYTPKEPLIKDEKIRKAVRAWAEANKLDELYLANNGYEIYGGAYDTVMQLVGEPLPHDNKDKTYTIAELCGEERE